MKRFLPLLFLPLSLFAQNELTLTHQAVFFNQDVDVAKQITHLNNLGITTDSMVVFNNRHVVFIPVGTVSSETLKAEPNVAHVAPVLTNGKKEFVTYRSNLFVQLNSSADYELLERKAKELNLEIVGANAYTPSIIELKTSKNGQDAIEAVGTLKESGLFKNVSPNLMHSIEDCSVNDPRFNRQWHLKNEGTNIQGSGTPGADINVEAAWAITMGSPNIKISIMDSGVDTLHPELLGKLLPGFDAFGEGTNGYPTPNFDEDGHGTACAGIAAANTNNDIGVAGVCPECKVIPVRIFRYQDFGGTTIPWSETQVFLDGIGWQGQVGNADVSSNSWGVPDNLLAVYPGADTLVNAVIDDLVENGRGGLGIPMLFSSGNDGVTDTIPIWPARYEKTIAVGATSMCDEHKSQTSCDGESWWAGNWGEGLDVSAPGVRVATIDMLGSNGFHITEYYNSFNGTSAACPNAAGVMALMLSNTPSLPEWLARKTLALTCEKVGGYNYSTWKEAGNWSYELGYGRVNAYQAVTYGASAVSESDRELKAVIETYSSQHVVRFEENTPRMWQLFDLNGRVVASGTSSSSIKIDHNGFAKGIYALRIATGDKFNTIKLVIP